MKEVEWTEPALADMAGLDKRLGRRIKQAVERFAATGAGNIKRLQGVEPPEYRMRVGDYRARFHLEASPRPLPFEHRNRAAREAQGMKDARSRCILAISSRLSMLLMGIGGRPSSSYHINQ